MKFCFKSSNGEQSLVSLWKCLSPQPSAVDIEGPTEAETPGWSPTYGLANSRSSSPDGIAPRGGQPANDAPCSLYDTGTDGAGTY